MSYYNFYRESNDFSDIVTDINLSKFIKTQIQWQNHLMIFVPDNDKISSYINLKYGDEMIDRLVPDRTPVPYQDYIPKRR